MSNDVFIYCYSKKDLKVLKSNIRAGLTKETEEEDYDEQSAGKKIKAGFKYFFNVASLSLLRKILGQDHNYEGSIMFFLQPLPLDMAKLFDNKHSYWKSGLDLFEYKVRVGEGLSDLGTDTDVKEGNFPYRIAGTQDVRNKFFELLDKDEKLSDTEMLKRMIEIEKKQKHFGYWGFNIASGVRNVNRGISISVKEATTLLKKHKMESFLYTDKAPFVPHLILYPGFLGLSFSEKKKITLK